METFAALIANPGSGDSGRYEITEDGLLFRWRHCVRERTGESSLGQALRQELLGLPELQQQDSSATFAIDGKLVHVVRLARIGGPSFTIHVRPVASRFPFSLRKESAYQSQ